MELNYIILAHKNPEQITRLIDRLDAPECRFYIHVDAKLEVGPFQKIFKKYKNVILLEDPSRKKIIWGDISIVKATLEVMHTIVKDNRNGYCILLSGQDYPLHSNSFINSYFNNNYGKNYISLFPLPQKNWENGGFTRLHKYKINKSDKRKHFILLPSIFDGDFYKWETLGKLNFLRKSRKWKEMLNIFKKRIFPNYIKPYGGGQWWAFPIETVKEILEFNKTNPDFLKYQKYTLIPDEIFFQSILMFLKNENNNNISSSVTYVNWTRPNGSLPVTFKEEDLNELKKASKNHLFARKFDLNVDIEILNKIDEELLN